MDSIFILTSTLVVQPHYMWYELLPKFRLTENSIRTIFIFGKWGGTWKMIVYKLSKNWWIDRDYKDIYWPWQSSESLDSRNESGREPVATCKRTSSWGAQKERVQGGRRELLVVATGWFSCLTVRWICVFFSHSSHSIDTAMDQEQQFQFLLGDGHALFDP